MFLWHHTSLFDTIIEKQPKCCEKVSVAVFDKIEAEFFWIYDKNLSMGQKILWEICLVVISGKCTADFVQRQPGKMSHARWLTTNNRAEQQYVEPLDPFKALQTLAKYVFKFTTRSGSLSTVTSSWQMVLNLWGKLFKIRVSSAVMLKTLLIQWFREMALRPFQKHACWSWISVDT